VLTGRHTCCGLQVLDARDPLACRCPDVERYIRSISHNKRIILLLNKMDLVHALL
jgi:nuclear GTP-binding protein